MHQRIARLWVAAAIPAKVLEFLAHKIVSNVRELEGALNRIVAHAHNQGLTVIARLGFVPAWARPEPDETSLGNLDADRGAAGMRFGERV